VFLSFFLGGTFFLKKAKVKKNVSLKTAGIAFH